MQQTRSSALAIQLVDNVFETPDLTIPQAQGILAITYAAAKNHVERLVNLGILTEIERDVRPRIFYAPAIFTVINRGYSGHVD